MLVVLLLQFKQLRQVVRTKGEGCVFVTVSAVGLYWPGLDNISLKKTSWELCHSLAVHASSMMK